MYIWGLLETHGLVFLIALLAGSPGPCSTTSYPDDEKR
jgi:hypothetical protein